MKGSMKGPVLAIGVTKEPDDGDGMDDESMKGDEDSDREEALGALADVLGVPEEKRGDFGEAMRAYVECCMG